MYVALGIYVTMILFTDKVSLVLWPKTCSLDLNSPLSSYNKPYAGAWRRYHMIHRVVPNVGLLFGCGQTREVESRYKMDTPSRLEQILSTYEVEGGHLNRECPRVVAIKIAEKVLDWKMLGYVLGLPREKVLAIDRDNQTEDQRKVAMFDEWKSFKGSDSTYLKLAEALCVRNRIDIVELLCNLFQSHVTTPTEMASPEEQPNVLAEAGMSCLVCSYLPCLLV